MLSLFRYEIRSQRKRFSIISFVISIALLWYIMIDAFIWYANTRIANEAKPIAWADIIVERNTRWDESTYNQIQSLLWDQWIISQRIQLNTNIPTANNSFLVQLLWVDNQYPLYGTIDIQTLWGNEFIFGKNLAVDQKTYEDLENGIIQIWNWTGKVDGIIKENIWLSLNLFTQGRQVIAPISLLEQTWLLRTWSRAEFQFLIKTTNPDQNNTIVSLLENSSLQLQWRDIDNFQDRISQISTLLNELWTYLILIIISWFLLVAVTTMMSIEEYLYRRLKTISIMQIIWLHKWKIIALYSLIFMTITLFAIWISIAISIGITQYISNLEQLQEFFIGHTTYIKWIIITTLLVWVAGILPLLKVMLYSPLQWLSENTINTSNKREKIITITLVIISSIIILHILWETWQQSALFSWILLWWLGIIYVVVLWLLTLWNTLNKRYTKSFMLFDAIRSTTKPWNTSYLITWSLIVALSVTLLISQFSWSFIDRLNVNSANQPNMFIINISKDDITKINENQLIKNINQENSIWKYTGSIFNTVLWRIETINNIPLLDHINKNTTSQWRWSWAAGRFTREFSITTVQLPANETLVGKNTLSENELSVDEEFAKDLWVTIWDNITFSISWRDFTVQIVWLRKSNRENFGPFFYFQLDDEQFKDAPVTYFITTQIPSELKEQVKKEIIAITKPWVSFIEIDNIIASVKTISTRIIQIVQILLGIILFFTCFTTLVCIQNMRYAKIYKNTLYHILWATKKQTRMSIIFEYGYLLWIAIFVSIILWRWTALYFIQASTFLTWSRTATMQWAWVIIGILIINWLFIRSSMQDK